MFPTLILHPLSQFQSFNNGNWKALEGAVRDLVEQLVFSISSPSSSDHSQGSTGTLTSPPAPTRSSSIPTRTTSSSSSSTLVTSHTSQHPSTTGRLSRTPDRHHHCLHRPERSPHQRVPGGALPQQGRRDELLGGLGHHQA